MTPLHWAVERGHADCAEVLIRYGADVNFENKFGKCPLELASEHGRSDMYEMLQVNLFPLFKMQTCLNCCTAVVIFFLSHPHVRTLTIFVQLTPCRHPPRVIPHLTR